jgi:hypothetical protein
MPSADGGGLDGYVVDGSTYVENSTIVAELRTDSRGHFGDITLAPGATSCRWGTIANLRLHDRRRFQRGDVLGPAS